MKIARDISALHVIAGLDPAHGGPSYSVPRLCAAMAKAGAAATLLSVDMGELARPAAGYQDCRYAWDYARVPVLRNLRFSSGLRQALSEATAKAEIIHDHGIWLMPNVVAGRAAIRFGKPLVISPRGMLAPEALAFSPMKKRLFWALLQGAPVRRAACLHATSDQEYAEIRNFGLCNPVAIIPNGIDLPELPHGTSSFAGGRTVLALGRIHPKKGLDLLIRAWAKLAASQSEWRLKIVGPAEAGHDEELATLADSLGAARVTIEDPVYGEAKIAALSSADLFVLSSRNENFGIAVAEALAAGTPVIATKGAPWGGLEVESCGWWIEHGVEPLAAALTQAMAMPRDALKAMGSKGRAWMARDFSWDRVASDLLAVYRWLARDEELPPVVRLV